MMASSSPLKDIEENFFECSLCLCLFTEPKQLPSCLHRYCKKCLENYIKDLPDSFKCPLCKYQYNTPKDGVDEYKTDFHTKSVVEFIQLQKSLKQDETRACFGCKKENKVTAYCFRCRGFLCEQCYQFHLTNDMIAEHQQHILDLKSVDAKNLTLEKISSLAVAPRCSVHTENPAQLICNTCKNVPICVACIYGDHEGHAFTEVKKLARNERENLTEKLSELNQHKEKLYQFPKKVEDVRENLKANVAKNIEKVELQHNHWLQKISNEVDRTNEKRATKQATIAKRKKEKCNALRMDMDRRIKRLKVEYEDRLKKSEDKFNNKSKCLDEKHDKVGTMLLEKRAAMDNECESFKERFTTQGVENRRKLQEISESSSHTINRYENFTTTTSTILASKDDWTDAQGIPSIRSASEPLLEDVRKELPALDTLSNITAKDLPLVLIEDERSVVTITDFAYLALDITGCNHGHTVITGKAGKNSTFIALTDIIKGCIIGEEVIEVNNYPVQPKRTCSRLSESTVATASSSGDVVIYDTEGDEICRRKDIKDIMNWSKNTAILAIATDQAKKRIFLGIDGSSIVFILDDKLNYLDSFRLPEISQGFTDILVHAGNLVVCEYGSQQAYVATMDAPLAKVITKLKKPALEGNWRPRRACADGSNFIYMLWISGGPEQRTCVITQYSPDRFQLLGVIQVDDTACTICTVVTKDGEKLVVCTSTGKLYVLGILA